MPKTKRGHRQVTPLHKNKKGTSIMPDYSDFADYEKWSTDNCTPEDLGYMPEPEVVAPESSSPFSPDEEF